MGDTKQGVSVSSLPPPSSFWGPAVMGYLPPCACQPCRGSAQQPGHSMKGLSVYTERLICLASPTQPAQRRGPWEQKPEGSYPPGRKGAQEESDPRGPLLLHRANSIGRWVGRTPSLWPYTGRTHSSQQTHFKSLVRESALWGPRALSSRPSPRLHSLPRSTHSPVGILVVDVESLRGAEELWGARVGGIRAHITNCPVHTLTCYSHYPHPRTQPTFRCTEEHLPHGPLEVLSLWFEGNKYMKPQPGFPKAPAQLVYRAKGGGKGYWHDMPSIGQAHGAHGWHSCLNGLGRESYCPVGPRGQAWKEGGGREGYLSIQRQKEG